MEVETGLGVKTEVEMEVAEVGIVVASAPPLRRDVAQVPHLQPSDRQTQLD